MIRSRTVQDLWFILLLAALCLISGTGCEEKDHKPQQPDETTPENTQDGDVPPEDEDTPDPGTGKTWRILSESERSYVSNPTLGQQSYELATTAHGLVKYWLFLPRGYTDSGSWPTILFLHGSGEIGDDLGPVTYHGPPKMVQEWPDLPFIVISPLLTRDVWWPTDMLGTLLEHVIRNYRVDQDRIHVTGLSLGGYGSWDMATTFPHRFASISPVAGAARNLQGVCALSHLAVWAFHGALDTVVPVALAYTAVNTLRGCGGDPDLTVYPDLGHNSWTRTYYNPDLYDWMKRQQRVP